MTRDAAGLTGALANAVKAKCGAGLGLAAGPTLLG